MLCLFSSGLNVHASVQCAQVERKGSLQRAGKENGGRGGPLTQTWSLDETFRPKITRRAQRKKPRSVQELHEGGRLQRERTLVPSSLDLPFNCIHSFVLLYSFQHTQLHVDTHPLQSIFQLATLLQASHLPDLDPNGTLSCTNMPGHW